MFVLHTLTEKYQSLNCKLYACFVDFEKAFDSVIHNIMFYKLCSANISSLFYSVLKVIVGHIFETSIKCLCFIRSQ